MNSRNKLLTVIVLMVMCASSVIMVCSTESDADDGDVVGNGTMSNPYTKFSFSQFNYSGQEIFDRYCNEFNGSYVLLSGTAGAYADAVSFKDFVNCKVKTAVAFYTSYSIRFLDVGDASFTITAGSQSANIVVHVISEPIISTHTISFSSNGSIIQTQTVDDGMTATSFNPTLDGYTFLGWYSDNTLSTPFDFSTQITSDITLFAKWEGNFAFTSEPTADGTVTRISSLDGTVVFDASASEGSLIVWDFGDGSTATGIYQTHYYAEPGTYTVRLLVYNDNGDVDMKEYSVSIPDGAVGGGEFDVRTLFIVLICILGGGLVIRRVL